MNGDLLTILVPGSGAVRKSGRIQNVCNIEQERSTRRG
jgi:hypothetical protein